MELEGGGEAKEGEAGAHATNFLGGMAAEAAEKAWQSEDGAVSDSGAGLSSADESEAGAGIDPYGAGGHTPMEEGGADSDTGSESGRKRKAAVALENDSRAAAASTIALCAAAVDETDY